MALTGECRLFNLEICCEKEPSVRGHSVASFDENDVWMIFIQIVRGLRAMHDLNIMHRDLKSANVFLNKDFTVKLGDMNVSKVVG